MRNCPNSDPLPIPDMKTKLIPLYECMEIVRSTADQFANTLEHDAPETAVYVLNELDDVASCVGVYSLVQTDAVAKLTGASRFMRRTFPRFSLGNECADALDRAIRSMEAHIETDPDGQTGY
jgi:hypothetical protein